MTLSKDYLRIEDLKDNHSYKIYARNAYVGIYVESEKAFIISRYKVGPNPRIHHEYHWDVSGDLKLYFIWRFENVEIFF
jgi:hypothetical protein